MSIAGKNMKTIFNLSLLTILLFAAPSPCFALWEIEQVSKERAKELGMEIRSQSYNPSDLTVELEFKIEGELKNFSRKNYPGHVELQIREGKTSLFSATLKEDGSKPGRVVVNFTADRAQSDRINLRVWVPGVLGGAIYELRVKEFVEPKKAR